MSGKESKRSKARRKLYSAPTSAPTSSPCWPSATAFSSSAPTPFQPFGNGVTMNVNDVATEFGLAVQSNQADAEKITELMDAPIDLDIAAHAISRGPNPYLDRCVHCSALRPDTQEGDEGLELLDLQLDGNTVISNLENNQPFSSFKLEIWTCAKCRKEAKNFQPSFLAYDLPFANEKEIINPLSFTKIKEENMNDGCEREELQDNWVELRSIVKDLYACEEEPALTPEHENRLQFLVDKLCRIDPHQLFLVLESQIREIVCEIKTSLLAKLKENGCDKPELALDFTSSLLSHYDLLTKKAHLLAQYLGGLSSHLKRFEVTWELLNKHLFHSIAHNDPAISNCGPTILEQLRQGSVQYERSKDDPYCSVRKRLLKFQEEMSVVVVVWRDCQQLIENYCHEEVKNTHKHVSSKTRSFISQQRQLLKDHLLKEPFSGEALTETMKNLMAGHKSSMERVMCRRCKRERCTCDECTITHRITCGIINSNISGEHPPNAFNFALDHTRNVMDITPPSMSSTTSSSGSVSPINIDDKLTTLFDHRDEFGDALLNCEDREGKAPSMNGDGNFENGEDDEADDEDEGDEDEYGDIQDVGSDEPHSLQDPAFLWEAMQEHRREQFRQQHVTFERLNHHNCSRHPGKGDQGCPFQPPINQKLSRELDAELAKSGILPKGAVDFANSDLIGSSEDGSESKGGGTSDNSSNSMNPSLCATCQCHACLKQSGHVVSTSLPLQVAASPSPADLHLYPHIHGLPQQDQKNYMFDLPHLMSSIKLPVKIDFDDTSELQERFYSSDWDSTMHPRPGSLAAQHQHQHHQRLSGHSSDLLPPPASPFTFDLASHLATHTTHTSTTNTTSAFKSVTGKHFASSIMPTLSNIGNITSEGSSVDPTKPLDFASLVKIPQSCLNGTGAFPVSSLSSSTFSCVSASSAPLSSVSGAPTTFSTTTTAKANGTCQGPPCSRPTPLGGNATTSKWEKGHPQHCKKFTGGGHLKQPITSNSAGQQQHPQHNLGARPLSGQPFSNAALKNLFPGHHQLKEDSRMKNGRGGPPCPVPATSGPRPGGLASQVEYGVGGPAPAAPASSSSAPGLACSNPSLNTMVNNIGVGTSSPCNDPECDVHHGDDNCDSVDDSCSEKSSSTTTSNQKEGKYCDCCYCEFFGHNNATSAKTSTNYIETKDRLRKILKKRQNEGKHKPTGGKNGVKQELCSNDIHDPLEKKGLEGLLRFINGTDDNSECKTKEKEVSAKAAKRARQKQKKLEEKAKFAETFHDEPGKAIKQLLDNPSVGNQHGFEIELCVTSSKHEKRPTNDAPRKEVQAEPPPQAATAIASSTASSRSTSHGQVSNNAVGNKTTPMSKASKENIKSNGTADALPRDKQTHQHRQIQQPQQHAPLSQSNAQNLKKQSPQRHQQFQQQPPQKQQGQQKQQVTAKAVNGKSPAVPSAITKSTDSTVPNHTSSNGKSYPPLSCSSNGIRNGQIVNAPPCGISSTSGSLTPALTGPQSKTTSSVMDSPSTGSGSSASQSPSCGTMTTDQGKTQAKSKKKKKNKNGGISCVDEIFMPKSESELDGDVDDFERELEEFKRFCFEPAEPKERRKIAVNVNLKDIFKKKTGLV
ncbi:protein fam193a-like [Plakobranchus ocellatus]|uniref:Protein fam193a-like n=1 Tax=Plakobranchus ocellatus TaxID=259542 RepID=A0AAV4B2F0_9GAST|nr:protein fam193a-like [Plakobranchus ocellatus]